MSIEALKLELINRIMSLKDVHKLRELEESLDNIGTSSNLISRLNKPMRKKINIEKLKKEQNYKPINKEEFFKKIDELNIEEPLEDLLRMI